MTRSTLTPFTRCQLTTFHGGNDHEAHHSRPAAGARGNRQVQGNSRAGPNGTSGPDRPASRAHGCPRPVGRVAPAIEGGSRSQGFEPKRSDRTKGQGRLGPAETRTGAAR